VTSNETILTWTQAGRGGGNLDRDGCSWFAAAANMDGPGRSECWGNRSTHTQPIGGVQAGDGRSLGGALNGHRGGVGCGRLREIMTVGNVRQLWFKHYGGTVGQFSR